MKIYTRTGDSGGTALFGGGRVTKAHARVEAYGAVDSANSAIGMCAAAPDVPDSLAERLPLVMSDLFDLGAELATPAPKGEALAARLDTAVVEERVAELERWIDEADAELQPLQSFVLPTGTELAARLHVARCEARRAERAVVRLVEEGGEEVRGALLTYLNRLSDLLFTWARFANHAAGRPDVPWQARKTKGGAS